MPAMLIKIQPHNILKEFIKVILTEIAYEMILFIKILELINYGIFLILSHTLNLYMFKFVK